MEGAYLPGNIRQRMQELMKEHKITREFFRKNMELRNTEIPTFVWRKLQRTVIAW